MRSLASLLALALASALASAGCSSDDRKPSGGFGGATGGGSGDGGSSGSGGSGGGAADAGVGGSAGTGGSGGKPASCGNNTQEGSEECDGTDLLNKKCTNLGFDTGTLACAGDCTFDTSGCSGTENCYDGKDNDGDGQIDCMDTADCATACGASCSSPPTLPDPIIVTGSTEGHASEVNPSCAKEPGGPEVVYAFTAQYAGIVEAVLTSNEALVVSLRPACASAAGELACSGAGRIKIPSTAGMPLFVAVDGANATTSGSYALDISSRAIACGDGHRDPGEECDDGQMPPVSGDGCSATCTLESEEVGNNDTVGGAQPMTKQFSVGQISPVGDVDVYSVTVSESPTSIIADTFDLGDGACSKGELDSVIDILASNGTTVLATDDDGGDNYCARATVSGLGPGTYYIRVKASASGATPTFPYSLNVVVDKCGNGNPVQTEECDDGNNKAGDGCSPTCKNE